MRLGRLLVGSVVGVVLLTACDPDTVTIRFRPEPGDRSVLRYEVASSSVTVLGDEPPVRRSQQARIRSEHRVLEADEHGVRVEVLLGRDGEAERRYEVRFDRASQLAGIDLVEGVPVTAIGQVGLTDVFPEAVLAPPTRALRPGDDWTIDRVLDLPGEPGPVRVRGEGRLDGLRRLDGHDVADVVSRVTVPVRAVTDEGRTEIEGEQEVHLRLTYRLDDGTLVEGSSSTEGDVALTVAAPPGILGPPVTGWLRYEIDTTSERLR